MAVHTTAAGLTNTLAASGSTDALHGEGGLTGVRSYVAATLSPAGSTLTFTRDLPAGAGWTTSPIGARANCEAFAYVGLSWIHLTPQASGAECWHLDVEDEAGSTAIHLGNNYDDQFRISQWLASPANQLLFTVGVRESAPLRVSWRRAAASWPRSDPRVLAVRLPQFELWTILAGTATAVNSAATALTTYATTDIVRDDRPHLKAALALLRAFYANPVRSLTWKVRGTIDLASATAPGALVTTATLAGGAETINAVITRRSFDLTEDGYGTTYECNPMPPDVEVIR